MALLNLDFESQFMGFNQNVNIILPDKARDLSPAQFYGSKKKYPVLWLLHGTFGGHSDWIRKSNIELYACEKELIVVMPGIGNADYEEWNNFTLGLDAEKYLTEELMPLVYGWLPASDKREDNFIAGLSMGGQGALRFALKYPELFAYAAVLSYAPSDIDNDQERLEKIFAMSRAEVNDPSDIMHSTLRVYNRLHRYDSVQEYLDSWANLYRKMKEADPEKLPKFFFACGDDDVLMAKAFRNLQTYCKEIGFEAEWAGGPGNHEWRVWERDIQKALALFLQEEETKGNAF